MNFSQIQFRLKTQKIDFTNFQKNSPRPKKYFKHFFSQMDLDLFGISKIYICWKIEHLCENINDILSNFLNKYIKQIQNH